MPPTAAQNMAQNMAIRNAILQSAVPIYQPVKSGGINYAAGVPTITNMLASPVGLIRRFHLEISGTINCAAGQTLTPTLFGLPNLISNVTFQDQNNRLRVNTTGMHLHLRATQTRRRAFGAAILAGTGMSDPTGLGSNFPVQQSTGVIAGGSAKNFTFVLEIPVVQSNTDLTGAVYANQTTSNNQLTFTMNPSAFVYNADPYNAAFTMSAVQGTTLPTISNLQWTLYQDFLDQLPQDGQGFAVLPMIDCSYALQLQYLNAGVQIAGTDNLYALSPFNVYQNLMLFWDNFGTNAGVVGGDVQYVKTQVANSYVLRQRDPAMLAIETRNNLGVDMPGATGASGFSGAVYDLDYRNKPLSVDQMSATNIVFRPTAVSAAAALNIGTEFLWFANQNAGG